MKRPGHSLRLVAAALNGHPPAEPEWPRLLETANRGWLGPALYVALRRSGRHGDIPPSVLSYLELLHDRNRERNRRLRAQVLEAARAMNARGVQPVLLKGAIHLVSVPDEAFGARMISDLDIAISPAEMTDARAALKGLGYADSRTIHEMGRPQDVGEIELHDRPGPRSARYLSGDLKGSSAVVEQEGALLFVPSATSQALHLVVHDMIKDGDYWDFGIDLRHLHDLAELARSPAGIDWRRLRAALSDRTARRALQVQATALRDLFGTQVPDDLCGGGLIRVKHEARLLAGTQGIIGSPARVVGDLSLAIGRIANGESWRGMRDFARRLSRLLGEPKKGSRL